MVRPDEMSLATLREDLRQVCGSLRWIPDAALCSRLDAHLSSPAELRTFLDALDAQRERGRTVSDNAYWLLKVNAEYLLGHAK